MSLVVLGYRLLCNFGDQRSIFNPNNCENEDVDSNFFIIGIAMS